LLFSDITIRMIMDDLFINHDWFDPGMDRYGDDFSAAA
jgi:hypothetical protein